MSDWFIEKINLITRPKSLVFIIAAILLLNVFLAINIVKISKLNNTTAVYFLSVGQGDSELIRLPGGAKILIDGGPQNKKAAEELSKILPPFDKTIDIIMLTHPQLDHYGGLAEVIRRHKITAFVSNSLEAKIPAFESLKKAIKDNKIAKISLYKNDKIKSGGSILKIINPDKNKIQKEKNLNETSLVAVLEDQNIAAIFTGDAGLKTEKIILPYLTQTDVLKIGHHGSKTSTGENFLNKLKPSIAVIEVGKNSYGHPKPEILSRLKKHGVKTLRTDLMGTINIAANEKSIKIFQIK